MTHLRSQRAMTLTELLVASIIMMIVMVGVVSIDYAIRSSQKSASADALLPMRTSAMMLRISRDAALAVGDLSSPGVDTASGGLCFRQESGGDVNVYTDDIWVCYSMDGTTLRRCTKDIATGPGACAGSDPEVGQAVSATGSFVFDEALRALYIDLAVVNRQDPAAAAQVMSNPEYTLSSRVFPAGHGY